ncbi:hypothetical protein ElyMa_004950400 [Elysia marginata]|uniref:Uncharacterized protein n=1 Tax=Elysia marginata TaxID=1093978 RepID=A0AAV4J039_9GAST|nr:hypothetical protein ElyMa_004950400 [Elysia marginata]
MIFPVTLLAAVVVIVVASLNMTAGHSSAVTLDVSHKPRPGTQSSGFLVMTVDPSLTRLKTIASLAVLGSKPYGRKGESDQLAFVDMWSNNPTLADDLDESDVLVRGESVPGRSPFLMLSWNSPTNLYHNSYTCVANGIDRDGQAES